LAVQNFRGLRAVLNRLYGCSREAALAAEGSLLDAATRTDADRKRPHLLRRGAAVKSGRPVGDAGCGVRVGGVLTGLCEGPIGGRSRQRSAWMTEETELFKRLMDNESFRRWMTPCFPSLIAKVDLRAPSYRL
jgi:hypothetical protein